jgi:hypothetical protein
MCALVIRQCDSTCKGSLYKPLFSDIFDAMYADPEHIIRTSAFALGLKTVRQISLINAKRMNALSNGLA